MFRALTIFLILFSTAMMAWGQNNLNPDDIKRIEKTFLSGNYEKQIPFPPLSKSKLWMPRLGENSDHQVCKDLLRIRHLEFLPGQKSRDIAMGDLPGYGQIAWATYDSVSHKYDLYFHRVKKDAFDPRFTISAPDISGPNNPTAQHVSLIEYKAPNQPAIKILQQFLAGSWRGQSSKIHLLNDGHPDLSNYFNLDHEKKKEWMANHAIELEESFIAIPRTLIAGPDHKLYWANSKETGHLFELTPKGPSEEPLCNVSMLPGGQDINYAEYRVRGARKATPRMDFPALRSLMLKVRRFQGDAWHCCGTMNTHSRKFGNGSRARSKVIIRPWDVWRPYNSASAIKNSLIAWSYQDPVSRKNYLEFLSYYDEAESELKSAITQIYGHEPDQLDQLVDQTLYYMIGSHFAFSSGIYPPERAYSLSETHCSDNDTPLAEKAYSGCEIDMRTLETDDADKDDSIYSVFAASLFNDPLFATMIQSSDLNMDMTNPYGKSILMYAAHINDLAKAEALMNAGADINLSTKSHMTGAYYYVQNTRTALDYALENAEFMLIMTLLDAGAKRAENSLGLNEILTINPHLDEGARSYLMSVLEPQNP